MTSQDIPMSRCWY